MRNHYGTILSQSTVFSFFQAEWVFGGISTVSKERRHATTSSHPRFRWCRLKCKTLDTSRTHDIFWTTKDGEELRVPMFSVIRIRSGGRRQEKHSKWTNGTRGGRRKEFPEPVRSLSLVSILFDTNYFSIGRNQLMGNEPVKRTIIKLYFSFLFF